MCIEILKFPFQALRVFTGYKYSGLQYGFECWCTNSGYDKYGKGSGCTKPCPGNAYQRCGGSWRNSVYVISMSNVLYLYI